MPNLAAARTFIETAELSAPRALGLDATSGGGLPELDQAKAQTLVVGSDVVSFTIGVEADFRQAIADSALFSQLVATKKVGDNTDPMAFLDAYFAALLGLGWMVQKRETAEFTYKGAGFDVSEAVIGVITAFLSPISGAAAAVLIVLKGLQTMAANAPFITLFNRQSQRGEVGRFQFTYVHNDPDHGLSAEIMAFALNADNTLTQVLFFRLEKQKTKLRRSLASLSVDTQALAGIKANLSAKVKDFRAAFVADADLGTPPG